MSWMPLQDARHGRQHSGAGFRRKRLGNLSSVSTSQDANVVAKAYSLLSEEGAGPVMSFPCAVCVKLQELKKMATRRPL